jgi:hypothetical protein
MAMSADVYHETVDLLKMITSNYDSAIIGMASDKDDGKDLTPWVALGHRIEDAALRALHELREERDIATVVRAIHEADALYLHTVMLDRALRSIASASHGRVVRHRHDPGCA